MPDETLLADDIAREAVQNSLLVPFDATRLKGASYELAAGRTIIIVHAEDEGITPIDLEVKLTWEIPPGRAAILYSLEQVEMPVNMKGRLSMKSSIATKLLLFAGGPVDPGYRGHLFLPLANLSDAPITITYGERIVTVEFIRLGSDAQPYSARRFDSIPPERLPTPPQDVVYDLGRVTAELVSLRSGFEEVQRAVKLQEPTLEATSRIVDVVVLGALAGIGAGAAAGGILALFTQVAEPWNFVTGGLAAVAMLTAATIAALRPLPRSTPKP